jgi:serine/threonine protein kinase
MPDTQAVVEELLQQCLDRMAVEGEQALERVCAEHPEHAEALRDALRFLSRVGLIETDGDTVSKPPEQIGDYRLLHRIGGGGMGEVYLAEQVSLGRKVALKLIRGPLAASHRTRERFRREVDAVSKLDHSGICPVHDAGEIDGTPYLVMRYVDGETLAARIAQAREQAKRTGDPGAALAAGRRSAASTESGGSEAVFEILELIEKVARALHAAHEQGLVHRDVKPANIMLTPEGQPVLLDFGLARQGEAEDGTSSLTLSGDKLGTPAYMAPEQVTGSTVDQRADVYGLGPPGKRCSTRSCTARWVERPDTIARFRGTSRSSWRLHWIQSRTAATRRHSTSPRTWPGSDKGLQSKPGPCRCCFAPADGRSATRSSRSRWSCSCSALGHPWPSCGSRACSRPTFDAP